MTDIFEVLKTKDAAKLSALIQNGGNPNQVRSDSLTALHVAAISGSVECLELLLKQFNAQVDCLDKDGNTPLHLAAKDGDIEVVKTLIYYGADVTVTNNTGKKPLDVATNNDVKLLLTVESQQGIDVQKEKNEIIKTIEAELPDDIPALKSFAVDLLLTNQLFQERCKETLRQLIEEKHVALHKYRLLENAAGIRDRETSVNFLSQLQYLQLENEQQAATIAYLKIQNKMLETSVTQQEEYYRKNLSEMGEQHGKELKIVSDQVVELEQKYGEAQKAMTEEINQLRKENTDLKSKALLAKGMTGDAQFLLNVQNENNILQQRVKELHAEKISLSEKLKSAEQMKTLHEQELIKSRNDLNVLRKIMHDEVLTEARAEADDRDENSGQILFVRGENGSKQIKGATAEKLVERLTDPSTYDSQFQASFLLTFRSFMNTLNFLTLLVKRYKDNVEQGPSISSMNSGQSPVQLRVCNTIKIWIEQYWFDFQDNQPLLEKLNEFVEYVGRQNSKLANVIKIPLNRKLAGRDEQSVADNTKKISAPKPKPILPKSFVRKEGSTSGGNPTLTNLKNVVDRPNSTNWVGFNFSKLKIGDESAIDLKLKFVDLDPLEIARQLTLIEYELFTAIKPTEFLDQAWIKEEKETKAPNICNMTKWSNHITHWVVTEIVTQKDNKNRAYIFERFVMVAQHLEKMNNFNAVKEVLAGMQSSAVNRLRRTREGINNKYLKVFEDLVRLTSSDLNFKTLRAKVHASDPPLIPFPGVYQSDLVFLDTCSKSKLENGLINFLKYQKIASYILELQVYQQTPYNFEPVPEIGDYFKNYITLNENEAYNESLICEPRGS